MLCLPLQALCRVALLVGLAITLEQILRPLLMQLAGGPQVVNHDHFFTAGQMRGTTETLQAFLALA